MYNPLDQKNATIEMFNTWYKLNLNIKFKYMII